MISSSLRNDIIKTKSCGQILYICIKTGTLRWVDYREDVLVVFISKLIV